MTNLVSIHEFAARQHGLVLVSQVRAAGYSRSALRNAVGSRHLEIVTRRVLRVPGAPTTSLQRIMVAVLDASPGAFACGPAAAALWGLPGFDLRAVHLVRMRGISRRPATGAILHEVLDLLPHHVTVLDGIPVVRPERAIFELCGSAHPKRAERALDSAWSRRLLSGRSLRATHAELAERGRSGTVVLRELLRNRPLDYVPPASNLEGRFADILADNGEPAMRRQIDTGGDVWIGRVDFSDERLPLVVEVQSERFHSALCDRRDDARRLERLRAAGFVVVEVTDAQVWRHPFEVVEAVRAARRQLRQHAA